MCKEDLVKSGNLQYGNTVSLVNLLQIAAVLLGSQHLVMDLCPQLFHHREGDHHDYKKAHLWFVNTP